MADDHSQRLFRNNEAPARGAPGRVQNAPSGNDPLAELARLIGQSDPFGEYARETGRQPAAPPPQQQTPPQQVPPTTALQWDIEDTAASYAPQGHAAAPQAAMPARGASPYDESGHDAGYYAAAPGGHEHDPYDPNNAQFAHEEQDFYDDVPPRRRTGILVIAGIFALAIVGTAGAFGYRAIFGSSGTSGPPPVIKADSAPSKIVPASAAKDASSKLITDRVNDRSPNERLVSREEKPIEINGKQADMGLPPGQAASQSAAASTASLGSGVVASEPKKIRTIAIHPDGTAVADATPAAPPPVATPAAPPLAIAAEPARNPAPSPRAAIPQPVPEREAPRSVAAKPAPAVHRPAAAPSNAPLSLSPDAPAPRAAAPMRTASVAPTQLAAPPAATASHGGGYAVQVSSQRSEAEAQAAFRGLQGKYPNQLGRRSVLIRKVDLGSKGIYYRAMVGPFADPGEAGQLCSSLKSAGGQCIVQRN